METNALLQGLLWGGLTLGLASELLRPKVQALSPEASLLCLDFAKLKQSVGNLVLPALIPIVFGIVLQFYGGFSNAAFLVAGFLIPALLSSVIARSAVSGLLLLGLAWLLPMIAPSQLDNLPNVSTAIVSGLLLFQLLQSMTARTEGQNVADARVVLPAALWLIAASWIQTAIPGEVNMVVLQSTTAAALLVGGIFRLLPISNNTLLERYGKPVALAVAAAGGVCVLADIVLHQPALTRWAILVLGSVLAGCYFAIQPENSDDNSLLGKLLNLAVLGIVVLAASRLYGTLGWVVAGLAIAVTHTHKVRVPNSIWQTASLFLLGRGLLQLFIYNVNPNVTGINITHPYAGAVLFVGIALVLCARDIHRHLSVAASMALWVIIALASCYYLHAEAAGSLLVSSLFAAGAVTFVPSSLLLQTNGFMHQSKTTLVLLAAWLTSYCALAAPGIELGNSATKTTKLLLLLIPFVVGLFILKSLSKKPVETVS